MEPESQIPQGIGVFSPRFFLYVGILLTGLFSGGLAYAHWGAITDWLSQSEIINPQFKLTAVIDLGEKQPTIVAPSRNRKVSVSVAVQKSETGLITETGDTVGGKKLKQSVIAQTSAALVQKFPALVRPHQGVFPNPSSPEGIYTEALSAQGSSSGQQECAFTSNQTPKHQPILINEVAWMGTPASANNEWIELKNMSNLPLNLAGWQLRDQKEDIMIMFSATIKVSPGAFLLLERTDDTSIPFEKADLVYTGALSNENEGLRLFDQNCVLIDEVLANSEWPAGDNASRHTLERSSDLTWHTYDGAGTQNILGTPKAGNSVATASSVAVPTSTSSNTPSVMSPISTDSKILISTIQIGGATATDEWIRLYNPNTVATDLTHWSLKKKTSSGTEYSLVSESRLEGKSIAAQSYLLLANDEGYAGSSIPDVRWAKSNTIASDNTILLYRNDTVVDKVGFGSAQDFETAPALDSEKGKVLQRKNNQDTDNNQADFVLE